VKLALVVQRYAEDIGGGSELHARYVAEHLAARADVRVLTTCARDYLSWKNEYPAGPTQVNGIPVERFTVARERDPRDFARRSSLVFDETHSTADELAWLDSQGPVSPELISRVSQTAREVDFVVLFSLRYHTAFHGARAAGSNAVLVPTTERDPAVGLDILGPVLRGARGVMYNTPEERALIHALHHNERVPGVTRVVETDRRDGMAGYEIDSERGRDIRRDLSRAVVTSGWGLLELRPMRMSLEDVFLSLTTEEVPTPPPAPDEMLEAAPAGELTHE